ncbi:MAG: response regulator [Caldithrix sp.]|nr:response regulator [Caldithrix sp.]
MGGVLEQPKILLIDDLPENIELLRTFFYDQNYKILKAFNGKDALDIVHKEHPDLIILDIVMPGMDGFQVAETLKCSNDTKEIPIIFITGMDDKSSQRRGYEIGVEDYITKPINMYELKMRTKQLIKYKQVSDRLRYAEELLYNIAFLVEKREKYEIGHSKRLAKYSEMIARSLGLSDEQTEQVCKGGALHDIGKIFISENILTKPGPLTDEEYEAIKEHPARGEDMVKPFKNLEHILPLIKYHNERYDGSGYPDGLKGDDIPLGATIIALVESYLSLTQDRPFRKAFTQEKALNVLRTEAEKGRWNMTIFMEFDKLMQEQAIHQNVETAIATPFN